MRRLSADYLAALRKHVAPRAESQVALATKLGRQAVALGLETLDLANLHEGALTTLMQPGMASRSRERTIKRGREFFGEAVSAIEQTHLAARRTDSIVLQVEKALRKRMGQNATAAKHLKRGIRQRQISEASLKRSTAQRALLLAKSRRLQLDLRRLTHKILAAQEEDRRKMSRQLHDEVAQILLAINVRLLTLKNAAKSNTTQLKKEVANTQRLVRQSSRSLGGFAHAFAHYHET